MAINNRYGEYKYQKERASGLTAGSNFSPSTLDFIDKHNKLMNYEEPAKEIEKPKGNYFSRLVSSASQATKYQGYNIARTAGMTVDGVLKNITTMFKDPKGYFDILSDEEKAQWDKASVGEKYMMLVNPTEAMHDFATEFQDTEAYKNYTPKMNQIQENVGLTSNEFSAENLGWNIIGSVPYMVNGAIAIANPAIGAVTTSYLVSMATYQNLEQYQAEGKDINDTNVQLRAASTAAADVLIETAMDAFTGKISPAIKFLGKTKLGGLVTSTPAVKWLASRASTYSMALSKKGIVPTLGRVATNIGKVMVGEGSEEAVTYVASGLIAKITTEQDKPLSQIITPDGMATNFALGAVIGAIMQAPFSGRMTETQKVYKKFQEKDISTMTSEQFDEFKAGLVKDIKDKKVSEEIANKLADIYDNTAKQTPIAPTIPTQPASPAYPAQPVAPASPTAPTTPAAPTAPVAPKAPRKPKTKPATPNAPPASPAPSAPAGAPAGTPPSGTQYTGTDFDTNIREDIAPAQLPQTLAKTGAFDYVIRSTGGLKKWTVQVWETASDGEKYADSDRWKSFESRDDALAYGSGLRAIDTAVPKVVAIQTQQAGNVGVHFGDLGKSEFLSNQTGDRGTGHYGTGTYFVSQGGKAQESMSKVDSYGDRPVNVVSFDGYNLYTPDSWDTGIRLHDFLKEINRRSTGIKNSKMTSAEMFKEAKVLFGNRFKTKEDLVTFVNRIALDAKSKRDLDLDAYFKKTKRYDSASTVFMKSLGYDGVDVRSIPQLDNSEFGSVIYDLSEKAPSSAKAKEINGIEPIVQRWDEVEISAKSAVEKPHGLYVSPISVESPHKDDFENPVQTVFKLNTNSKKLVVDGDIKIKSNRFRIPITVGAGVHSAIKYLGDGYVDEIMSSSVKDLRKYWGDKYPEYKNFFETAFDQQEILEMIGGILARNDGYDMIVAKSKEDPQFTEYVLLTENAFEKKSKVTPVMAVKTKPKKGKVTLPAKETMLKDLSDEELHASILKSAQLRDMYDPNNPGSTPNLSKYYDAVDELNKFKKEAKIRELAKLTGKDRSEVVLVSEDEFYKLKDKNALAFIRANTEKGYKSYLLNETNMSQKEKELTDLVKRISNRRIKFFETDDPSFNIGGFVDPSPGFEDIYYSRSLSHIGTGAFGFSATHVIGHELTHKLRNIDGSNVRKEFEKSVSKRYGDLNSKTDAELITILGSQYVDYNGMNQKDAEKHVIKSYYNPANKPFFYNGRESVIEEIYANEGGSIFSDPVFWEEYRKRNPQNGLQFIQRVGRWLRTFLNLTTLKDDLNNFIDALETAQKTENRYDKAMKRMSHEINGEIPLGSFVLEDGNVVDLDDTKFVNVNPIVAPKDVITALPKGKKIWLTPLKESDLKRMSKNVLRSIQKKMLLSEKSGMPSRQELKIISRNKELVQAEINTRFDRIVDELPIIPTKIADALQAFTGDVSGDIPQFTDPVTEKRYGEAKRMPEGEKKNFFKAIRDWYDKSIAAGAFDLDYGIYANVRDALQKWRSARQIADTASLNTIKQVYGKLTPKKRDFVERVVLLTDLSEDIVNGLYEGSDFKLPFGFRSKEEVLYDLSVLVAHLDKKDSAGNFVNQDVIDAIKKRKEVMDSARDKLIEEAIKVNYDLYWLKSREAYFRHNIRHFFGEDAEGLKKSKYYGAKFKERGGSGSDYLSDTAMVDYMTLRHLAKETERVRMYDSILYFDVSKDAGITWNATEKEYTGYNEDTHVAFDKRKLGLYFADSEMSVARLAKAYFDANQMGLDPDSKEYKSFIRRAEKSEQDNWIVIPKELANVLESEFNKGNQDESHTAFQKITGAYKAWALNSFHRAFKYNVTNFFGDSEALLMTFPKAMLKVGSSVQELYNFYKDGTVTDDLKIYIEEGGLTQGMANIDLRDWSSNPMFKFYEKSKKELGLYYGKEALGMVTGQNTTVKNATEIREQVLRYAAFKYLYADLKAKQAKGKAALPDFYGASLPKEIQGLDSIVKRAMKLSNDALGAYNDVSSFGQGLSRTSFPFYRFREVNARRMFRVIKNVFYDDPDLHLSIGETAMRRATGAVKISAFAAKRAGMVVLGVMSIQMVAQLMNHVFYPEDEERLPDDMKNQPHLLLPSPDGKIRYWSNISAFHQLMQDLGLARLGMAKDDISDVVTGKMTIGQKLSEIGRDSAGTAIGSWINGVHPAFKTTFEVATGVSLFPNVMSPTPIRDKWEYVANTFGLKNEYKYLSGKPLPQGSYAVTTWDTLSSSVSRDESDLYAVYDFIDEYQEINGQKKTLGIRLDPKSQSAYYYKQALKLEDYKSAEIYLKKYMLAGGTYKDLNKSLDAVDPTSFMKKSDKMKMLNQLTPEQRERYDRAIKYIRDLKQISISTRP